MKLTLKIACGVFLGILAAILVYKAVAIWEAEQASRLYVEEQKQEAEALKRRIENAAGSLLNLTPNELIKRCGRPLQSTSDSRTSESFGGVVSDSVLRTMYFPSMTYLGADAHTITLTFDCVKATAGCRFAGMKREREIYDLDAEAYESFLDNDGKYHQADTIAEVRELPCLAGQ